jgi:ribonuclease P protein subunit RPR2
MKKQQIAKERIEILFKQAKLEPEMANRYVQIARKLAMKARISLPTEYKRKFCKHCKTYFQKENYKIRFKKGKKQYHCLTCKKTTAIPYK